MSRNFQKKEVLLNGKLVTVTDGMAIGDNFKTLTNMRYTDSHPRSVGGMTKVNTTALSTYLKTRSGYHFIKKQPSESHLLVQAYNTGLTASQVLQNTTAIPSQGNFSATALHTDSSGAATGRFSNTPNDGLVYCNDVETMFWGGDEFNCSGLINYSPDESFKYDFSEQASNTLTDSLNIATLTAASSGVDSNVMLLLHLDNNVTDSSPTTPHTLTNNNVTFDSSTYKFASHSAVFNGTNAELTIPDNADYDFSGGTFTIEAWINVDSLATNNPIFYDNLTAGPATNYFLFYVTTSGALRAYVETGAVSKIDFSTANSIISTGSWYHVALVENADSWYIFVNGKLKAFLSSANRTPDYDAVKQIGSDSAAWFDGYMDEYRISNTARYTSDFETLSSEFSTNTGGYLYVGSIMPLDGFKVYIETANTSTSTMSVSYWDGSIWTDVSTLSDGTATGGKSLAQTGSVTFDTTESVAKVKSINQTVLFWYRISVDALFTGTQISYITVSIPFQDIQDLWDGNFQTCISCQTYKSSVYDDNTVNVYNKDYSSANTGTYANFSSIATGTDYAVFGFYDRMQGVNIDIVSGSGNATVNTVLTVYYWNGASWVAVSDLSDGTFENGASFAKSGLVTWTPPASSSEFKTDISKQIGLYYYKFAWAASLDGDVKVDAVAAIPAQKQITGKRFSINALNRLWLVSSSSKSKNEVICSSEYTDNVFNGEDSLLFQFGDNKEIIAGTSIYSQFGASLYEIIIFCKEFETWILTYGDGAWNRIKASGTKGCVAPLTMRTAHIGFDVNPGMNRQIAIWQGSDGIYMFDGRMVHPIHEDIKNYFDKRDSSSINTSYKNKSIGFIDQQNQEYHWCFASGTSTTLDKEFVYDIRRQKWYEINRGAGNYLQCGIEVVDTNGNTYEYGAIDTGYLERLENGNNFDGTDITSTMELADIPLSSYGERETVRQVLLYMVAKATTTNTVTGTHYADTSTTGNTFTLSPSATGKRIASPTKDLGYTADLHGFKFTMVADDETIGFEPLHLLIFYGSKGLVKK